MMTFHFSKFCSMETPLMRHKEQGGPSMKPIAICVLLLLAATSGWGQLDRGTIDGLVTDPSGAVVPGAKVQVIRIDTNSVLDLQTNSDGLYTAPNLPPANYRVVVQKEGFVSVTREPIEVRERIDVRVDVSLQAGVVTQSVTVTGETPLLNTAAISNSSALQSEALTELPLITIGNKRDVTTYSSYLPTTYSGAGISDTYLEGALSGELIVGVVGSVTEVGPAVETVGEVNIVSNAFNAEYGGVANVFNNVSLKSGTNELHGMLYDHLGNDKLNARSFFQPKRTVYRQNEGGFNLGGPVVLPHIYNGRNKTFFFGSLDALFSRYGASGTIETVPTPAFVDGNFSGLVSASGAQIPIFDPLSQQPDGKGSYVRTQFPNNIIPASRIVQLAQVVGQYMPAPTLPGIINNYNSNAASSWPYLDTWVPLLKVDQSISSKQKLTGSYTYQDRPRELWTQGLGPTPKWGVPQTDPLDYTTDQIANSWKIRLSHNFIATPMMVNYISASVDRYYNQEFNKTTGQGWDQKLGITGMPADDGSFPPLTFSGGAVPSQAIGRAYHQNWHDVRYSIIENLTWVRGKHTMKFGMEIDRDRVNDQNTLSAAGAFTFTNSMTSQPDSPNYGSWGNAYASFLLGAVGSASATIAPYWGLRRIRYGLFAQDEWHATRKLTVSYGLRWDFDPPFSEVHNQMASFQPGLANPGAGGLLGALAFIGTGPGRCGCNFQDAWKKGLGPRLGISYQLDSKTVIRVSGGIYHGESGDGLAPNTDGFGNTPSFSSPDGYTPLYYLNTGTFPQNFARPPQIVPTFDNGQAISFIPRDGTRLPQTFSWNFSIQREVFRGTTIETNYIGNRSTNTAFSTNYNYLPISDLQYGSLLLQPISSAAAAAAGFSAPFPGFASQTGANTVYQSLRPYPQYTAVTIGGNVADPVGETKYNSLQIKANRRLSKGLLMMGWVTWSKSFTLVTGQYPGSRFMQLDATSPLIFSVSWAYQLPFGKNQSLLNTNSRVVDAIVSGWKINGLLRYNDGVPLTISGAAGSLSAIGYGQYGNAVLGVSPYLTTNPRDFNPATNKYLNAAAFTTSTGFNFGTLGPDPSWIRGFWGKSESLNAGRVFRIRERVTFDFSIDAINPFNFVRWGNPNTTLTSAAFGAVTTTATAAGVAGGRTLQINGTLKF